MKATQTQQESSETLAKKGSCIEFFSAYQDFDVDRMLELCAKDATVNFAPLGEAGRGPVNVTGKGIWSALMESFPDIDNTVRTLAFNEGSNEVICQVVIFGKQEKDFAGLVSKGLRFDTEHIFIFKFDNNSKIKNIHVDWNHEQFVKQLTGQ